MRGNDGRGEGVKGDPRDGGRDETSDGGYRDDALIVAGGRRQCRVSVSRGGGYTGGGRGPRPCRASRIGGMSGNGRGVDGERGGGRHTRRGRCSA